MIIEPQIIEVNMYDSSLLETIHVNGLSYYNPKQNINDKNKQLSEDFNIVKQIFSSIFLLLLIIGLLICFSFMLTKIFNTYGFHIAKVWLVPALIILFLSEE